ncbi:MAG TPA: histidine phosphatase family protein [Anaerolineales bacterium]|nr:histidine phosphatase family protein [Anaerolineales bacterium]
MENRVQQKIHIFPARSDLWLVRHGQTDWNLVGRWQGQSPQAPGLNEAGRAQALALQSQLAGKQFAAVYSSDLLRARQTADLLAEPLGLPVSLDPRLREMDLGDWEGLLSNEISARFPQLLLERDSNPVHTSAPRGETPACVAERVASALDDIVMNHCGQPVLIVAHGLSLAVVFCLARGFPLDQIYGYVPGNASLLHVEWEARAHAVEFNHPEFSVV